MNQDMRSLFFVVKGQYSKGAEPSFVNKATGDVNHIGGYDPFNSTTTKWYMVLDNKTFNCVACGGNLDKVLKSVYKTIKTYKGVARNYFKHVSEVTSDDYYEVHYLGRAPLTHDQRVAKAEGRCPRVSPAMRCIYERVFSEYGDYYEEEVQEMEDLAYSELKEELANNNVVKRSKKLISRSKKVIETPKKEEVTTPPKKVIKPKVKFGVKRVATV